MKSYLRVMGSWPSRARVHARVYSMSQMAMDAGPDAMVHTLPHIQTLIMTLTLIQTLCPS